MYVGMYVGMQLVTGVALFMSKPNYFVCAISSMCLFYFWYGLYSTMFKTPKSHNVGVISSRCNHVYYA